MFKRVMMLLFLLTPVCVRAQTASDCDFNNNGRVDFPDFIAFASAYGTDQGQFDLNGDARVNFRDFVIFASFYGQTATTVPIGIEPGMQAPDFTLQTPTGERFNLYEQRGKPVFLNFWATWCGPCLAEMPDMKKLHEEMGDQILIVGIDLRESRSVVQRFVIYHEYTWTFVMDFQGTVGADYGASAIPTSYFLDANGVIVRRFIGAQNYAIFLEATQQAMNARGSGQSSPNSSSTSKR